MRSNCVETKATRRILAKKPTGTDMDDFKIKVARVERTAPNERGEDICLTFQFECDSVSFALPIFLKSQEFDDTELVKAARSKLHAVFQQLVDQCEHWRLTDDEYRALAAMNVRPAGPDHQ